MRILYIQLINFVGVKAAMGLNQIALDFSQTDKHIIQLYGKNRCGKTVMIQQLHPYSSINLNGDERSELSLIIPGEVGIKKIIYDIDGETYTITHTYKPSSNGKTHTVFSSLLCGNEELNPSGGVTVFNNTIEQLMGINKYTIQFIINGTQLTSIANMTDTQRKNLINKAMGIDIYDKIHKLATDDYRYTNKLITSLNQTREYILTKYGSYDTLLSSLKTNRMKQEELTNRYNHAVTKMSTLEGTIQTIQSQNVEVELNRILQQLQMYQSITSECGTYSENAYDQLVNQQLQMNQSLSTLQTNRMLKLKDLDITYAKRSELQNTKDQSSRSKRELDDLQQLSQEIEAEIKSITVTHDIESPSSYLMSMHSLAQAVNGSCNEILKCLNEEHLKLLCDMIMNDIDIGMFIMQENGILNDSEKERSTMQRMQSILNTVQGDMHDECEKCYYKNAYKVLDQYFRSYQQVSVHGFTLYDLEQFDHAYKNWQTILRLINVELSKEVSMMFQPKSIAMNLLSRTNGIDVTVIHRLMEEAAQYEHRKHLIERLESVNQSIRMIQTNTDSYDYDTAIQELNQQVQIYQTEITQIETEIQALSTELEQCDTKRMKLSQIKNINVSELLNQQKKLSELQQKLNEASQAYAEYSIQANTLLNELRVVNATLENLENDNNQYLSTSKDIEQYTLDDTRYKIIAEATSSTKGKPVVAIKEKIDEALTMTNRLLDVMYGGEIRMLKPIINETEFTLPFRVGCNQSPDIRYGSQSESTLLSLALSLSLASSLNRYDISTVDELDAYLDSVYRDNFLLMLQEIMGTLHMEQLFLISHGIVPGQYSHIIHEINLSEEIMKQQ